MALCKKIEPGLPADQDHRLEDLAYELVSAASALAGQIHPAVQHSIGDLVRSMNCYYSNLIEGHNTVPRDIERALAQDYSTEPHKRDLQLEAVAHIEILVRLFDLLFQLRPWSVGFPRSTQARRDEFRPVLI
jgi:hypothetical protein